MDTSGIRRSRAEEDQESYFVSMSDMLVGLLFIFIVLLAYFALTFRETTAALTGANETRKEILLKLKERIEKKLPGLIVQIDSETGVLRLPDSILFESGAFEVSKGGKEAIAVVAGELLAVLPCYTHSVEGGPKCQGQMAQHKIDALLIEGHTDTDRLSGGGPLQDNLDLSALRATRTFKAITQSQPGLEMLVNRAGSETVPILGVAGYGELRPVPDKQGSIDEIKKRNRRIDLRFLMVTPRSAEGEALRNGLVK